MAVLSQTLFRISAILNAASILGHIRFGFHNVYPALATVPSAHNHNHNLGKTSARNSYDFANFALATIALLNWQWSRTLGPVSVEEQIVMWALVAACAVSTWRFTRIGLYGPLICTVFAPACSVVGWWMA